MRAINPNWYKRKRWRDTRAKYLSEHPYCEECLRKGIITPAKHVHHIRELDEVSIQYPDICYGDDNLIALCIPCHNAQHGKNIPVHSGYRFTKDGRIEPTKLSDDEKKK